MDTMHVGKGTIFDFKLSINKYVIKYTNSTNATLTKTQLTKIIMPMVNEGASLNNDNSNITATIGDAMMAATPTVEGMTTNKVTR